MNLTLEDYFKTSFEEKLLIKMPERENDHLTVATRLLEKRREMHEIDQALNAQKEEFHMKMESLTQRKEDVEKKDCQLRESLLMFDKSLKDNDAKKNRAIKKTIEEQNNKRQREKEITEFMEDIDFHLKIKVKLGEKLKLYNIFQRYLEHVVETSKDFSELREIVDRYNTLTSNFQDLVRRDKEDFELIEKQKQNLSDDKEEKNRNILQYNITLGKLQNFLDKSRSQSLEKDVEWTEIIKTAAKKTLTCGKIRMAIYNLYQISKKYQRHAGDVVLYSDIEGQLTKISQFIEDLKYVQRRSNDSIEDIAKDLE